MDKTRTLLLLGANYFQVVFTLPDKLAPLILSNRNTLYDLLLRSAWRPLAETLTAEGPFTPAALTVLRIVPKGYTRCRHVGGYHGRRRATYLAGCRALLAKLLPAGPGSATPPSAPPACPLRQFASGDDGSPAVDWHPQPPSHPVSP